MKLEVLGCSGGIGGREFLTTSLRIDDDILIDCGTGVGVLDVDALARIDHVFLTHSHLDHIALLPMLIDSASERRDRPLHVHGAPETLAALRAHVFNWTIWPDFTVLPGSGAGAGAPLLTLESLAVGDSLVLGDRRITPIPAEHAVPTQGYVVGYPGGSLAFSGDTTLCPAQIAALNAVSDLHMLIIETALPDARSEMALVARHLSPHTLHDALSLLTGRPEVYVTHLKPGHSRTLQHEVLDYTGPLRLELLRQGQVFDL
ncbi:MAG: 3',5'-cyclic-nucleotide phosphodiesterase [Candidatus Dactylopiibacterium sp.]|nr:3',5'-cyclic-nucleotide phosphodiesterase [Candidatus Dactylopiibacterium sp.]